MIKHLWFDFSNTLARVNDEAHDRLCYKVYSEVTGKPIDDKLVSEYKGLYSRFGHSNAAIFHSLGCPPGFWSDKVNAVDPSEIYQLMDPQEPKAIEEISKRLPVSIFSNIQVGKVLAALGIPAELFTHTLSSSMVKEPKPALDGFRKMVELSGMPAKEILYVGDDLYKDVRPAKQVGIKAGIIWSSSGEADYSFKNFEGVLDLVRSQISKK